MSGPAHRVAQCGCGQLRATCRAEPRLVSVCHCLDCQRRSGSAFSAQVRFNIADVTVTGPERSWTTTGDSGRWGRFRFCPTCGDQIAYEIELFPDAVAIPLGAFENPHAFTPRNSVWESRRHPWVEVTGDVEHD